MSTVSYDSFEYAFKRKYEKDQIASIYKNHFKIFDATKKIVNILDPKKKAYSNLSDNHKLKIIFQVYASKELFKIFYDSKSPEFKEIFKLILWGESEKKYFAHKLEKKFNTNIMNQFSSYGYSGLLEEYQLFSFERDYDYSTKSYQYNLFLPKQISKIIKQSIEEKPESYYLKKYDKEIKTEFFYQNNDVILKEISLFKKYLDSKDNKDVTLSNIKMPVKKDFVYIRKNCIVGNEFFSKKDKDIDFIREELLYKFFLSSFYTKKEIEISPLLLLKNTIDNLKSKSTFITFNLFNHLKNKNNLSDFNFSIKQNTLFIKDFFDFIETLKESEFYSIESIIDYFILRDLELNIFSEYDADRMYLSIEFEGYKEKIKIDDDEIYSLAIIKPLIKGMFFLF